jgi:uncharacterized protein (DUF362 family)
MASKITRREFVRTSVSSVAALGALSPLAVVSARVQSRRTRVVVVRTSDRRKGVTEVLKLLKVQVPRGGSILIKPNFNTADLAPGSTHNDTLRQLITELWERDARAVTIGESSGPPVTRKVMEDKGIFDLAKELKTTVVNFEELAETDWVPVGPAASHWPNGVLIPRLVAESPFTVSTCCLKTHGFGGVLSMSLKLAVGLTPKTGGVRRQMHGDKEHMRRRIAEINLGYKPAFIVMDGVEVFTDGGPSSGNRVTANVFVGGTDRIAVDGVGVAILKELGSNSTIMGTKIFEHDQIARAVQLGLGITGADQIDLVTGDAESRAFADKIKARLAAG